MKDKEIVEQHESSIAIDEEAVTYEAPFLMEIDMKLLIGENPVVDDASTFDYGAHRDLRKKYEVMELCDEEVEEF